MESGLRHLKKSKFLFIVNNCIYCLMAVALVAFLVSSPHILIIILLLVLLYRLYIKDSTLFMITLIMMLIYFISYQCQVKSITSNDNSDIIIELLLRCVRDTKATLLVTSHALHYKNRFDICIDMKDINRCSREGSYVDTSAS